MNSLITSLSGRLFSVDDVAAARAISGPSARVLCHRYVRQGKFLRLKKDMYILREDWNLALMEQTRLFEIANHIQVPSYISLTTALSWYELTTQIPQGVIESMALKRSYQARVDKIEFRYLKLQPSLYGEFTRRQNLFIATPEKALADCIYLAALGRYALDVAALEHEALDTSRLENILHRYPSRAVTWWKRHGS